MSDGPKPVDYILEISFPEVRQDLDELVRGQLYLSGSSGDFVQERGKQSTIAAFFEDQSECLRVGAALEGIAGIECRSLERERVDWLERYEQSLVPLRIGQRFLVAPSAELIDDTRRLPIVIPQERAFGTGSHASTALCLEMLESVPIVNKRCVDIGTGSGILAIGMARLGAARVFALDNDSDSVGVVRANLLRNGVGAETVVHFIGGPESLRGRYDVLTMNIIPEVIVPLLPDVVARMGPDSLLILSGILLERREDMTHAASRRGLQLGRQAVRGEWWCGQFRLTARAA